MTTKHKGKSAEPQADPDPAGEAITLSPATAVSGDATDITLVVTGTAGLFDATSEIFFNGLVEPTTLIDPTRVSTGVKPSLFVVPAVCPVHVVTGAVATQAADFTFTEAPVDPALSEDEMLTAQLRSWGISGEPVGWAPDRMQAVIVSIRFANTGFGTPATVQGLLDSTFPLNEISAADVCVAPPTVRIAGKTKDGHVALSVEAEGLPDANITWLDGQGVVLGHGHGVEVPDEVERVTVQVAVAGSVFEDTFER